MTLPDGSKQVTQFTPYGEVEYKGQIGTDGSVRPLLYNTYSLDGNHLLSSAPYADNNRATTYVYNADGSVWQQKDPVGTTVYLTANAVSDGTSYAPALTRLTLAPNGLQTVQYHDRHGQVEKEVRRTGDGAQSLTTKLVRNAFDQVIQKTESDQTGKSRTWAYRYTNDGNLTDLRDPEQNRYQYEYDALGNLVTVTENQVLTTKNHYNALSWKLSEQDVPSGATESSSYNLNGTLNTFTDKAGNRHAYRYTPFWELASIMTRNAAGTVTNYETKEYVPNTSLVQKETNSYGADILPTASNYREITYRYDAFQRLQSQTVFGRTYQLGYTDRDDLLDSLTYPDGTTVSYQYDPAGRLQEVNSPLTGQIQYDYHMKTSGESQQLSYPNGLKVERELDSFGQVEKVTHRKENPVWNERNQYAFGNVVSIERNGTPHQYFYDKVDRLTKEVVPGTTTYTFDERNRLRAAVNTTTGVNAAYTYFGNGLRATKVENGIQTNYVYLNGHVIEELDAAGNVTARNVWGNELLFRKDAASDKKGYYAYNSHGDVVSIADETGKKLNAYVYDTWGNVVSKTEEMSNPFQYSGEIYDEKTGFYYLRARYYDSKVGRFISEDAYKGQVENPLSLNRYVYTANNPLRYRDPTGHSYTWSLNLISQGYNSGLFSAADASMMVFGSSALSFLAPDFTDTPDPGEPNFRELYTPFHEIAQINVAKQLYQKYGQNAELAKKLATGETEWFGLKNKYYEADIVLGNKVWEGGNCYINVSMESFFLHLKKGGLYPYDIQVWMRHKEEFIDFYNVERPQRKLNKLAPIGTVASLQPRVFSNVH
nr:RHS repeat-associated core domain-containing protein [Brevibacillus agri]